MTKEDKELLLKDLCARLPYGVRCRETEPFDSRFIVIYKLTSVYKDNVQVETDNGGIMACTVDAIQVYLRPMSSMTEEEAMEYANCGNIIANSPQMAYLVPNPNSIDWLLKNHFDYRGLIDKGLAIGVTKENNPYEN